MHVSAPVAIWTYVYAYLRAGGDPTAIWTYVAAYRSARGHMDLRVRVFERWRGGRKPDGMISILIWTYVSAQQRR